MFRSVRFLTTLIGFGLLAGFSGTASADNPPTVSITSPENGSTLTETVKIEAMASDDVGLDRVRLEIDGYRKVETKSNGKQSHDFSYTWDTTWEENGGHTIKALAYDTSGQSTAFEITVSVNNLMILTVTISQGDGGQGTVTSSPAGISCPDDCAEAYPEGAEVILTATPAEGSSFQGWLGGDDCNTELVCRITMIERATVWATFKLIQPPTVSIAQPVDGATVSGTIPVQATASDDESVSSVDFLIDGIRQVKVARPPYIFVWDTTAVSNGAHTLEARAFDKLGETASALVNLTVENRFTLTVNRFGTGQGRITSSPPGIDCGQDCVENFEPGTRVALTAAPAGGSTFRGWSGACSAPDACLVELNSNQFVSATFNSNANPASSDLVYYDYDEAGQLVNVAYDNGTSISYSYDEAGNLLTRSVDVPLTNLYFPFYQTSSGTFLGIAVSNYSSDPAVIRLEAFGTAGQTLPLEQNPSSYSIPAQSQLAKLGSEIFAMQSANQSAWIELESENAELGSFFQFGDTTLTQLDGSIALDHYTRELYLSRIYEGDFAFRGERAKTYLSLANPTEGPVTVRMRLHALAGSAETGSYRNSGIEIRRTIPARGFLYDSVAEIFGTPQVAGGYVDLYVTEGQGLVAFELIELPDRRTVIGLSASFGNMSNELYSAQLADGSIIYTSLKLINISDQKHEVRITPVGGTGGNLKPPQSISLEAGQQVELDSGTFFGFPTAAELTIGSIKVETDGPGVIGDVLFGDPLAFKYAASMPLQTRKLRRAIFSQVATTSDFFTGLAFYNPDQDSTDVTINVYNAAGQLEGTATKTLLAGGRMSGLIPELVPSASTLVGGYIVVDSTRPLIAQQIFGQAQLNQFSAVPPKVAQ